MMKMSPMLNHRTAGFTLIELLIAMAIASIIMAAMYAAFEAQVRGQVSQDVSLQMTQSIRSAMEIMAADIRMAGCDPENAGAAITTADADELIITMDIGGGLQGQPDGDTIDAGERVHYAVNADGDLGREVNVQNAMVFPNALQPLHSADLECEALNFIYLDADGNPFVPATEDDREDINAIQVSMVVRSADAVNPGFLRAYSDNTSYVNLQGDEILPPQNDAFRRFQLSETIDCRNL